MLSNLNNTPSSPCLKTRTHSASNITSNFNEANSFKISPRFALFANRFNSKNEEGKFLGETSDQRDSEQYCQFIQTRTRARAYFTFEGDGLLIQKKAIQSLEPTPEATQRTKDAVSDFFSSAYNILERNNKKFPLAGKNKCLGMVAVPGKKLAILAISQDKNPDNDRALRSEMLTLLESMNQEQGNAWIFELASIPTKSQYMMPRTLFMRTTLPAISSWVSPRTQCVEVALMVALCKVGRQVHFSPEDVAVMAFGGTLWTLPYTFKDAPAVEHFDGAERNTKYTTQPPLSVNIGHGKKGWLDIWDPCDEHCKIYRQEMLAIGASGGPATSFTEPRAETNLTPKISI